MLDWDQIVPREWVEDSTRRQVAAPNPDDPAYGYGYLWWTTEIGGHPAYFAAGYGRQYIAVVPDLDLVVVMTGDPRVSSAQDVNSRYIITDFVVPAVRP